MACKPDAFSGVSVVLMVIITFAGYPWIQPVENARILAVEPIAAKSHWNFISSVIRSLTDAGHHVTMYTPLPDGDRENYTEVDMSGDFQTVIENDATEIMGMFGGWFKPMVIGPLYIRDFCKKLYRNDGILALMEGKTKADFDVMIIEPAWTDCSQLLASTLNVPTIFAIPSPMMSFTELAYTGNMPNPACVANMMASHAIPKTFVQRLENTVLLAYSIFISQAFSWILSITDPQPYDQAPVVFPSIIFQNSHYVTEASRPITPNLIDVGGIHLKPPKSLPNDILDFLDDAPNGAIYLTFGSMVKFSTLPKHILETFVKALGQVPQKVLWKFEDELKNKPKNVMTRKWFPQREILLHPNVKLFISHGGMSGVYEAVDASVPVLGFPLFFDQPRNIDHLVHYEMAISLDLFTITEDKLLNSISELINNEKYMKNAKITSEQFKDRPMTPQQSVVYWVEYVIRHKGAPHLKSHGLNLTWYQYFLLDVIAVVLICILLVLFIVYNIFKCICGCTSKSSRNVKVKSH